MYSLTGQSYAASGGESTLYEIEWVKFEHPWTAISAKSEVNANHRSAQNNAIWRHCSAYPRRQNLYVKTIPGLQRAITCQRLIHNWVRPHWGLTA